MKRVGAHRDKEKVGVESTIEYSEPRPLRVGRVRVALGTDVGNLGGDPEDQEDLPGLAVGEEVTERDL